MTVTVNGPNGVSVQFPAGTDADTINRVMREATGLAGPAPAKPASPDQQFAEPDAKTMLGRGVQAIMGKRDPRYKAAPELVDTEGAKDIGTGTFLAAKTLAGDDAVYGDMLSKALGDRMISRTKDANGYDLVTYKGRDGQPVTAYVNKPGLGLEDINRAAFGAIPYMIGGGIASGVAKNAPLAVRALAQGGAAGATSMATDAVTEPLGNTRGIDIDRAKLMAVGGAAAEPLAQGGAALWRRFVKEPALFDRRTGQLTAKGVAAAQKAGLDPNDLSAEARKVFASTYAKTGDETMSAIESQYRPLGVDATRGQLTKDRELLREEMALRHGIMGAPGKAAIDEFDKRQTQQIAAAVDRAKNVIAPTRAAARAQRVGAPETLDNVGNAVKSDLGRTMGRAKAIDNQMWDQVPKDMTPKPGAFDDLPAILQARLDGEVPIKELHPYAHQMQRMLDEFVAGTKPTGGSDIIGVGKPGTVDNMRRILGNMAGDAASNPGDGRLAKQIYAGFNDAIEVAAKKQLLDGDPMGAANLVLARNYHREMKGLFEPKIKGRETPAAQIVRKITEADAPENVVSTLFGPPGAGVKPGSIEAVRNLRKAHKQFLEPETALKADDQLKLAYVMRLFRERRGDGSDLATPQMMLNNVRHALNNQRSMTMELLGSQGARELRQLERMLQTVTYKDPNPSGSGYVIGGLVGQFVKTVLRAFGGETAIGATIVSATQVPRLLQNEVGRSAAARALTQSAQPKPVNGLVTGGMIGGFAGTQR